MALQLNMLFTISSQYLLVSLLILCKQTFMSDVCGEVLGYP
jgi:hypothetical protein